MPTAELAASPRDTLSLLQALTPLWLEIRERRTRSLVTTKYGTQSGDPQLEFEWHNYNQKMDDLLEDYFSEFVTLEAVEGIKHEKIISKHAEKVADRGRGTN